MTTTTTTAPQASDLSIEEFCLQTGGSHGRPLCFSTDDDEMVSQAPARLAGAILVRIGVDLEHDQVVLDPEYSSELGLLDAAISNLQRVREVLAAVTPSSSRAGRCMQGMNWGRCKLEHDHQGACEGPSEAEYEASYEAQRNRAPTPLGSRVVRSA